ncbi:ABC transporter ATP-binding protein [Salinicoccus carnicancri]|uniref:ATP-binding cassette domain-containing protein n=1 Tax=Salinicoccus carnicancri TaxID=558170 RepID=UPI00031E7C1E|nr:ABC transporter ATP-binding protein [Salinicoccus carnicancri]
MLIIDTLEMDYGKFQMKVENMHFGEGLHVILGPNGSGKSSMMRGIIGYGGKEMKRRAVCYEGERVLKTHRFLSYLPQNTPRFRLSVGQYISLTADAGNRSLQDSLLERFDLHSLSENTVEELSGGEFKRVQCAQVAMEQKAVLLLDEVEQGLDLKYQHRILKWMKGEAAKKTVIANMHDVPLAMTYADTMTMMRDGKVLVQGVSPEDVTSEMLSDCYSIPLTVERREGRPWVFHDAL